MRKSGGLTPDENPGGGAEYHCTIITLAESTIEPGNIWVGTDDGNVQVTRNYGGTWAKVGTAGFPGVGRNDVWVSRVEPSHHARGTAYASLDGHRYAISKPYIFKTTDYGKTWTSITNNLPDGSIYVVKEDLKNPNLLFAGSEFAAYYSLDGGARWNRLNTNFPTVAVLDMMVHPRDNDLLVATMGRGLWVMDDITPLQQMTPDAMKEDAKLFENRVATQWLSVQPQHYGGQLAFVGANPTRDAVINYYLSDRVTGDVKFEVTDAAGTSSCSATVPGASRHRPDVLGDALVHRATRRRWRRWRRRARWRRRTWWRRSRRWRRRWRRGRCRGSGRRARRESARRRRGRGRTGRAGPRGWRRRRRVHDSGSGAGRAGRRRRSWWSAAVADSVAVVVAAASRPAPTRSR